MKIILIILFAFIGNIVGAQKVDKIPIPKNLEQGYPRLFIRHSEKSNLKKTIQQEDWAKDVIAGIHEKVDKYVNRHINDSTWIVSRLQMYWNTKCTNVYINGPVYSHADGKAPVPTVKFSGSRNSATDYGIPDLKDIKPYMDDPRGLYLPNKSIKGKPFEWVEISKTGGIVASINEHILSLACDASFLYFLENDEHFAKFAFDIFDTYIMGMYYRNEPVDQLHGHIQTIVGLTGFQVIHENAFRSIAELYDFLHNYIEKNHPEKIEKYEITIKKWNDQIIKNGVPQNNWNLIQSQTILIGATVLQDDDKYKDKKGRQYYINYILNVNSIRQWSLTKFLDYGYDKQNGVWAECPGYSMNVTKDLTLFLRNFQNTFDYNLLPYVPVMEKAVKMLPQYLFPNGESVAFGDSHYGSITTESMSTMVRIAQKNGDKKMEKEYTSMYRLFDPKADLNSNNFRRRADISSFFSRKPLKLNPDYKKGKISDYITQTFYAPNVSWFVQRIGWGKNGMMLSLNGSLGNHMHANGINMELYGKGFVQGPDAGKGSNYLQPLYLEYYSQFPAHNTVMVDGISSYTEMLSHHAFKLISSYPKTEQKNGFYPNITYSDVYFLEPESQSDQNRLLSIVKTGETTGYYIDVFRSKKQLKGDKFHDYFYHNLGQSMNITNISGEPLKLSPSDEMSFAGGHIYAFDYMWDKKSVKTDDDYQVLWKIDMPEGKDDVFMNLWMKGTEGREVFSIKSPHNAAISNRNLPYDINN